MAYQNEITTMNKSQYQLIERLKSLGFSYDEAQALRRIEMTLQRWAELECGDSNGNCIERDCEHSLVCTKCGHKEFSESPLSGNCPKCGDCAPIRHIATGKPYRTYETGLNGKRGRSPVADREGGALKRLAKLMASHPSVVSYHQVDPRGCALYVVPKSELKAGDKLDCVYTRGVAVCI